jgi:CDP-archaeol synthase
MIRGRRDSAATVNFASRHRSRFNLQNRLAMFVERENFTHLIVEIAASCSTDGLRKMPDGRTRKIRLAGERRVAEITAKLLKEGLEARQLRDLEIGYRDASSTNPAVNGALDSRERYTAHRQEDVWPAFCPSSGCWYHVLRPTIVIWIIENPPRHSVVNPHHDGKRPVGVDPGVGTLAATAAIAGDLFSSFMKRRLNLPPSSQALGLDQVPESLFPLLAYRFSLSLTAADIALGIGIFFVGELVLSRVLYKAHLRDEPY